MERKVVKTRNAEIWMDEQGIVHHIYNKGASLTIEDTMNESLSISEMCGNTKVPILVDIKNVKYVPRESRVFYAGEEAKRIFKAAALLVGSQTSRVIGSFFIGLNKPAMPVKLYSSEKEAIRWLKDFIN